MARIPLPTLETMTSRQRTVYEKVIAGPREALVGPLRAALHCPELADGWQSLGAFLRYQTTLPPRISELAILVTARRWNSELEWYIHAAAARMASLPDVIIEAIRYGLTPEFESRDEAAIYDYVCELQEFGHVSDPVYQRVLAKLSTVGIVELTAIVGYYTMVSMTLNAHEILLPNGEEAPKLPVVRNDRDGSKNRITLTTLSPAQIKGDAPLQAE